MKHKTGLAESKPIEPRAVKNVVPAAEATPRRATPERERARNNEAKLKGKEKVK